ncbi:MAG: DinB family protein [Acidobacteriota bacterium]|nr:DinB family protein [Acidobacteriota bacterium]
MKTQIEKNEIATEKELFVKMVIAAWDAQNKNADKLLATLSDEQLAAETAPGANSGIYLLGHLTAVNDGLLPLLDLGDRLYPQLEEIFLKNPDKSGFEIPSIDKLKRYWNEVKANLATHFNQTSSDEWFTKHNAVSDEDFAKEPHRNKLNVLISRTNHQSYHLGQLSLLAKK